MLDQQFRSLVNDDVEAVNALIIDKIQEQRGLIDQLAKHIFQGGGKRLRPLVVLLSSHACNYQGQHHIALAAMIELFHTATLLHDDVIDASTTRRGRETANEIWGSKASILVGDYLFSQYMQLMIDIGNLKIMRLLTDIALQIGCGEIKQLSNRHNYAVTLEEYFYVIRSKTSLLFAASAKIGAIIAEVSSEIEESYYQYGLHLGNAFQLIDDALDYCGDTATFGKNLGNDLADGKATLPILHVLKHGTSEQQNKIKISLKQGTLEYLPDILIAIQETEAIEYTKITAQQEVNNAIKALAKIPDSVYKNAMCDLANYVIIRNS